ncbi:MAG TPA: dTDP-glucose 4,6-dehydratase [Streptosporangiaceae bacterium]|nr:dTDP-glucose 4,6-dehydratase [Streptosporangiaceae bacterium]
MRILVTGGGGFIGGHYVRTMLDGGFAGYEDAHVTVIDKFTYAGNAASLPNGHPRLTVVRADIRDTVRLIEVLPGHDAVVHFAAESHVDRSLASAAPFMLSNVLGTQNLLDCCVRTGVPRVVHISTDEVYGSIAEGAWDESCPLLPNSPYSASKASSDLIARAYWRSHDLNISITRCSNNYGPYQYVEKVIPLFVTRLLDGLEVPLYGDGGNVREWLHVADHCRAVQAVLEGGRPGEIYNIGGGVELSNLELTGRLLNECGRDWSLVKRVPDRKAHDLRYAVDYTKIREELDFAPQVDFTAGLCDVVDWYRSNRWWWEGAAPTNPHRDNHSGGSS